MKKHLKLMGVAAVTAVGVLFAAGAQAAPIASYNITNAYASGFGGWNHSYSGVIASNGAGKYNYTNGSGTLNNGVIPSSHADNQLFTFSSNSVITLFFSNLIKISEINIFGGNVGSSNSIPGTLSGATVTIGGTSAAITSVPFGPACQSTPCNDKLSLLDTVLANVATNQVVLSNFKGGTNNWSDYYNIGEITVNSTAVSTPPNTNVPEPATLTLLGLGLLGFGVARKRKQQ